MTKFLTNKERQGKTSNTKIKNISLTAASLNALQQKFCSKTTFTRKQSETQVGIQYPTTFTHQQRLLTMKKKKTCTDARNIRCTQL